MNENANENVNENDKQAEAAKLLVLAERIEAEAEQPDAGADAFEKALEIPQSAEYKEQTRDVVVSFVHSYRQKAEETPDVRWLQNEFSKYPKIWKNNDEMLEAAEVIVERVESFEAEKRKLAECREKGISRESYLKTAIETGAKAQGVTDFGKYAQKIDSALAEANEKMRRVICRADGDINNNPNLDGLIAEQEHANTFNIDAAAKERAFTAEAPQSIRKNSVDIFVSDSRGEHVRKYQSKYGKDAKATARYYKDGNYRGQRKIVPKEQTGEIPGSTDKVEFQDVESKPLSKEQSKEIQRKAQEEGEIRQYEWNEVNGRAIARGVGKRAGMAALLAVGFQGARILGRRIWNSVTGKPNNTAEEDAGEFARSALQSGASAGLTVAATGGITVAIKNGWLGPILKATPVGRIANAVCVGIENIKILGEFATGKISGEEALDKAGDTTVSLVGSLALGAKGMAVGAAIGSVLGPVGTAIGGIAGGIVGGIAGSTVGHAIWEGGKAIVKTVANTVKAVASGVWKSVKSIGRGIASLFGF